MKHIISVLSACLLALALTACDPGAAFSSLLTSETQNASVVENQAAERLPALRSDGGYGFQALQTDEERRVYSILDVSLSEGDAPSFVINDDSTLDNMGSILEMYKSDHPEIFWIDDRYGYEYVTYATCTKVSILLSMEGEALAAARREFDAAVDSFLGDMPEDLSAYEKELYINDTLVALCTYDDEAAKQDEVVGFEQNAYGALVGHKAVCEGYTRAFQLLCRKCGIECVPVNGTCEDGGELPEGNHIWNAVRLDDGWYYVDATWNDCHADDDETELTEVESHIYFNITTEQLTRDHTVNPVYGSGGEADYYNACVPDCTSETYNYFRQSVPVLSDLDDCDEFLDAFSEAANNGEAYFIFRVSDDLDFDDTMDAIAEGYAAEWIEDSNSSSDRQISSDTLVFSYREISVAAFRFAYE